MDGDESRSRGSGGLTEASNGRPVDGGGDGKSLRLTRDEPGARLVLEGSPPAFSLSHEYTTLLLGGLTLYLMKDWLGWWNRLREPGDETFVRVGASLAFGMPLAFLVWIFVRLRRSRRVVRVAVDRLSGAFLVEEAGYFGRFGRKTELSLSNLPEVRVRMVSAERGEIASTLMLDLSIRSGDGNRERQVPFAFTVDSLAGTEETADFAFRFAAAAGLDWYRVLRNDGRELEIALRRGCRQGDLSAVRPSEAADYAGGRVDEDVRKAIAMPRIPEFEPASFHGPFRVLDWRPGLRVRIRRGVNPGTIAAGLAALGGIAIFALAALVDAGDFGATLLVRGAFVTAGAGILVGAFFLGRESWPRELLVEWDRQVVTSCRRLRKVEIPFAAIRSIGLRIATPRMSGRSGRSRLYWRGELCLGLSEAGRGGSVEEVVVETALTSDGADGPRRQLLPLATELAGAMGVDFLETS